MSDKKIKLIDFSQGIRSTEIQQNFEVIQNEINKERKSVAGSGISYGLDFYLNQFSLNISQGCLIDNEGEDIYIEATTIEIDKPVLIEKVERSKSIDNYNRLFLEETPYALSRTTTSDNVSISQSGVQVNISGMMGEASIINIASIDQKVLYVSNPTGTINTLTVDVTYKYTFKRRDIIFIDKDFKIQYRKGITSPSPSIPRIGADEYSYILGYIEVDGHFIEDKDDRDAKPVAKTTLIKEFKSIRNVYTDENNMLYLCGTPFDAIKIIHMEEPSNPTDDTLWYDEAVNKLKIWRHTDKFIFSDDFKYLSQDPGNAQRFDTNVKYSCDSSQLTVYLNKKKLPAEQIIEGSDLIASEKAERKESKQFHIVPLLSYGDEIAYRIERYDGYEEWVPVNDASFIPVEERKLWTPEMITNEATSYGHDLQYFFFNLDPDSYGKTDMNLLYTPNKNSLNVLINQIPLHSDQFDEITLMDIIAPAEGREAEMNIIRERLIKYYGYENKLLKDKVYEEYENIGIGFRLGAVLDKNCHVEAKVIQHVNGNSLTKRFQRTATFVTEGNESYQEYTIINDNRVYHDSVFQTKTPYRYGESQLEVFINGRKLIKDIEFSEGYDLVSPLKGANSFKFKILPSAGLTNSQKVMYKITASVYSYDHLEGLLGNFDQRINDIKNTVETTKLSIETTEKAVNDKIEENQKYIEQLKTTTSSFDQTYMKKDAIIKQESLDVNLLAGISNGLVNVTLTKTDAAYFDVSAHCTDKDFVLLFNTSDAGGNKILKRGDDYDISTSSEVTTITIKTDSVHIGHILYLTGVKFSR